MDKLPRSSPAVSIGLVAVYLISIVAANLLIVWLGRWWSVVNAFLFIGLDLVTRDLLHDAWHGRRLALKMGALIVAGSLLSWLLNRDAAQIAVASFVAFALAAMTDTIVYAVAVRRGWTWLQRSNTSNVASAAVDSLVFPTIAFGGLQPALTALQFVAKIAGGAFWSITLERRLLHGLAFRASDIWFHPED